MAFQYEIIRQSEKAILAKVPYWEATDDSKKKNKQLYYECWIPKAIIAQGDIVLKNFVIQKRNEKRITNAYQKNFYKMPSSWNTMGEMAPEKVKEQVLRIDEEKLSKLREELMQAHGVKHYDRDFFNSPLPNITDEVMELAGAYRNAVFPEQYERQMKDDRIPKKTVTFYRTPQKTAA